jgi:hypothetical protein
MAEPLPNLALPNSVVASKWIGRRAGLFASEVN